MINEETYEKKCEYKIPQKFASLRFSYCRWIALFLACMLLFGDAYAFDNPQPLQTNIEEDLDISHTYFNLLYSCYSFPNMIIPIFGGFLIDFLGVRVAIFFFSTLLIIGQLIVTYGGFAKIFWLMLLGRIVFGIGSESLTVSQTSIVSMWFKNQELAFALSLNFSIPKLGSSLNSLITPRLYNLQGGLTIPLLMGTIICVISWIYGIFLCCMDRKNEKQEGKISKLSFMKKVRKMKKMKSSKAISEKAIEVSKMQLTSCFINNQLPLIKDQPHCFSATYIGKNVHKTSELDSLSNDSCGVNMLKSETSEGVEEIDLMPEIISVQDIKNLRTSFWILMAICMLTEGLFIPFLDNANKFYQFRFGYDSVSAGNILIIPYVLSSVLSPIFGYMIDKIGKRGKFIILATFLFLVTHYLFAMLPHSDDEEYFSIIPLVFLGICFSLYSSVIMPSIPLVVDSKILGTALGLVGICQNSALAIFPLIVGAIFDHYSLNFSEQEKAYYYSSMFFVGISFLVFLIAICLEIYDDKTGRILDKVYLMTAINKNNIENLEKNNIKNNLQKKKEESEESISDPIHKSKKNKKSWEIRKSF